MKRLSLAALLLLSACATGVEDLKVTSATPASVTVWGKAALCFTCVDPEGPTEQQITDAASAHCSRYGKVPRRAYEERYEMGRTITFDCVAH